MKLQKGNAVLPILFLLVTLGILVGGGYFVYKTVATGKIPSPIHDVQQEVVMLTKPKIDETAFAFISDPLLRQHLATQATVTSYRATGTSSGLGDGVQTVQEIVMHSGQDADMRSKQIENGKESNETITIGNTVYVKDYANNSWWKQTQTPQPTPQGGEPPKFITFKPEDVKQTATFKSLGQEACGPLTCYHYQEKDGETTRDFWFDTKEFLLRKQTNGFGEFSSTQEFSYDNISLTPPTPTKDVPKGKSIFEVTSMDPIAPSPTVATQPKQQLRVTVPHGDDEEESNDGRM